ncbi:uncharacterized protein LOC141648946 [Silene latifolia]|uniref:uncharacterized protein LOC141648946 n=1 Tax=Silene latifolia TaxID=37657 RepID=UPI003D776BEC
MTAPSGYVKINVDAGAKEGEGTSSGMVCRNESGAVMWGAAVVRNEWWDPSVAEAIAMWDGLDEARRRGMRKVVMESDCMQLVEALKGRKQGRSIFAQVIDDILTLSNEFESVLWSYTSRVNNSVAHCLAHINPRTVGRVVWSNVLPPTAQSAVLFDISMLS